MIIVVGYRSVESFFLPFDDVFEGRTFVPDSVGDEAVFVREGPDLFFINISAGESKVWQWFLGGSEGVEVGVDTWDASFIGSVKLCKCRPYFSLNFKVVFEVADYFVVLLDLGFVVILVEFAWDVVWRIGVLMW